MKDNIVKFSWKTVAILGTAIGAVFTGLLFSLFVKVMMFSEYPNFYIFCSIILGMSLGYIFAYFNCIDSAIGYD